MSPLSAVSGMGQPLLEMGLVWLLRTSLVLGVALLAGAALSGHGALIRAAVYRTALLMAAACAVFPIMPHGQSPAVLQVRVPSVRRSDPAVTSPVAVAAQPEPAHEVSPVEIQDPASALDAGGPPSRWAPSWREARVFLVVGWGLGSMVLLLWLLAGALCLARRYRQSLPAREEHRSLLRELSQQIGVRTPGLRACPRVRSPLLAGLWRPSILLPPHLCNTLSEEELRAVLVHELSHLQRNDCWWAVGGRLLCALLWPQPLLWLLVRRLEDASEEICDREVLEAGCSPHSYARCLVDLAEQLLPAASERLLGMGIVPRRTAIAARVEQILRRQRWTAMTPSMRVTIPAAGLAAAALGLFLFAAARPLRAHAVANTGLGVPNVTGTVLDPRGAPVSGIEVKVIRLHPPASYVIGTTPDYLGYADTDAAGHYSVSGLGPGAYVLTVEDRRKRWIGAAVKVTVRSGRTSKLPAIRLTPGLVLTGTVMDRRSGLPLEGLTVAGEGPDRPNGSVPDVSMPTDANGRFQARVLPGDYVFWVRGPHDPDHLPHPGRLPSAQRVPVHVVAGRKPQVKLLVDANVFGTAVVTGRVTLPDGSPAAGIHVMAQEHEDNYKQPLSPDTMKFDWAETVSRADGTYRLTGLASGFYNISVEDRADRWVAVARERVRTAVHQVKSGQDLVLSPGGYIEGKVVSRDTNQPISGVSVGSYGPHRPQTSAMIIGTTTDREGHFRLHVAPGNSLIYIADGRWGIDEIGTQPPECEAHVQVEVGETKQHTFRLGKPTH